MTGAVGRRRALLWATLLTVLLADGAPVLAQQDSLDLATTLRLAREQSPVLRAAAAGVRAAEGGAAVARSARLPRLSAEGLYLRYDSPPAVSLGALGTFAPMAENTYAAGVFARQPLYASGRITAGIDAARSTVRAAELTRAQMLVDVTAAAAQAHHDVLLAQENKRVAEKSVAVLARAVDLARAHYQEGTVSRLDVLRSETRLSSARAALRRATTARATAREALAAAVGLDPARAPPVRGHLALEDVVEFSLEGTDVVAETSRGGPSVRAQSAAADAARSLADAARAARRPAIGLFLAGLTSQPELISGEDRWGLELAAGVSISWPLYDGGAAAGEAAGYEAEAARLTAEAAQEKLSTEAAALAWKRQMDRARSDVATAAENVDRAERALAIAEERYAEGVGLQLEVLEAEADLTGVRGELARAIHDHHTAYTALLRAMGLAADALLTGTEGS